MHKQLRKRFYLYVLLTIATMIMIFIFSSQNADESSQVSGSVLGWILDHMAAFLPEAFITFLEHYIRKVAHFSVYLILGVFACLAVREWRQYQWRGFFYPWLIAVVYAVSDEFHQSFVPGRACQFRDVCIDSAGAAVGIAGVLILLHVIAVKRTNKKKFHKKL